MFALVPASVDPRIIYEADISQKIVFFLVQLSTFLFLSFPSEQITLVAVCRNGDLLSHLNFLCLLNNALKW